jgi:hypothetical protein
LSPPSPVDASLSFCLSCCLRLTSWLVWLSLRALLFLLLCFLGPVPPYLSLSSLPLLLRFHSIVPCFLAGSFHVILCFPLCRLASFFR